MKAKLTKAAAGAMATAAIPPSIGLYDWRVILGSAAAGAVAGYFGIDLARIAKQKMADRKTRRATCKNSE